MSPVPVPQQNNFGDSVAVSQQAHSRPQREIGKRVFVNRAVNLNKIRHYGFDMDYTLAMYKWPVYSEALYSFAMDEFVGMGYPEQLGSVKYDIDFPVRGLWFDTVYGTFLKVDTFGNILMCVLGYRHMSKREIENLYPNRFIALTDRMYIFNTPFNVPELMFFGAVINFYVCNSKSQESDTGIQIQGKFVTFAALFADLREAIERVHMAGKFKAFILDHLEDYIEKNADVPLLLTRLKESRKNVFLITNSDWQYTNAIMKFLFDHEQYRYTPWTSCFDLIVVDGRKPRFFTAEGTPLNEIDRETGEVMKEKPTAMITGHVYSGGNVTQLEDAIGISGKSVLYIGDHIYGDILKCKKNKGWKTFLVVEELDHQLACWLKNQPLIHKLEDLDSAVDEKYMNLDSSSRKKPDVSGLKHQLRETINTIDLTYGKLGGLFHSGTRETFFASQVKRFADIYATSCTHLCHYPFSYYFKATRQRLPHEYLTEANVAQYQSVRDSFDKEATDRNRMTSLQANAMLPLLSNIHHIILATNGVAAMPNTSQSPEQPHLDSSSSDDEEDELNENGNAMVLPILNGAKH